MIVRWFETEPLPNHQSGDTPAAPGEKPTPEEKAKAELVHKGVAFHIEATRKAARTNGLR
jgi:hypothetical protein